MKKLIDIYEKLDINKVRLNDKFPIDGTLDDIIEFLEEQGFKKTYKRGSKDVIFNSENSKCFCKLNEHLWFGDTSKEKISKDNPIFVIKLIKDIKKVSSYSYVVYYLIDRDVTYIVDGDKKEFLKELNKVFGWE